MVEHIENIDQDPMLDITGVMWANMAAGVGRVIENRKGNTIEANGEWILAVISTEGIGGKSIIHRNLILIHG
jgi:hypothetical protein